MIDSLYLYGNQTLRYSSDMKIAVLGNYSPRMCGIATFTHDLVQSILLHTTQEDNLKVFAMSDNEHYQYPEIVTLEIQEANLEDYHKAAKEANESGADCCLIQHEFGIFGGDAGTFVLAFLQNLRMPCIVTLHTVLERPQPIQRLITRQIADRCSYVVVMCSKAVSLLESAYQIPINKLKIIPHPHPPVNYESREAVRRSFGWSQEWVITTFGFLGRSKSIETAIRALPRVIAEYPNTHYYILGRTHPNVILSEGESYRQELAELADVLGISDHIHFENRFLDEDELMNNLLASDLYLTPYKNKAQITSGTLAFAIGAGTPVVSTPYWHAEELIGNSKGALFEFNQDGQLSETILDIRKHPEKLIRFRQKAKAYGELTDWPATGKEYLELLSDSVHHKSVMMPKSPEFTFKHLHTLSDETGIMQHAIDYIPNPMYGYSLDDNSRALILCVWVHEKNNDPDSLKMINVFFGYIRKMALSDGSFINFIPKDLGPDSFHENEDAFGRTFWALSVLYTSGPSQYKEEAFALLNNSAKHINRLKSSRGMANIIVGLTNLIIAGSAFKDSLIILEYLTQKIQSFFDDQNGPKWKWYDEDMSYDNGFLPYSLLFANRILKSDMLNTTVCQSVDFLESICFRKPFFYPIGNSEWYNKDGRLTEFAQQPIEAFSMMLLYREFYYQTKDSAFLNKMNKVFTWFLGNNRLGASLYDPESGGCMDGLGQNAINLNQGAESLLAFWLSHHIYNSITE
ncbi:MAG: glycosyltransferase family 4 protein [Bacteroidota bacterium]|nr:glycosyltransferase family 4 protein [Bacteroidota bacterium]